MYLREGRSNVGGGGVEPPWRLAAIFASLRHIQRPTRT
jgi:hypothetical protein